LNPGSLGQPKTGSPAARYAGWEKGSVTLKSRNYPVKKTAERIRAMPVSEETKEFLIRVLRSGGVLKSIGEKSHV